METQNAAKTAVQDHSTKGFATTHLSSQMDLRGCFPLMLTGENTRSLLNAMPVEMHMKRGHCLLVVSRGVQAGTRMKDAVLLTPPRCSVADSPVRVRNGVHYEVNDAKALKGLCV